MGLLRAYVERCGVLTGLTPLAKVSLAAIANDARRLANIAFDARRFVFKRDATISTYDAQIPPPEDSKRATSAGKTLHVFLLSVPVEVCG